MQSCRRRKPLFALLPLLVLAACTLATCGNGGGDRKLLSASTATELRGTLDGVEQKVNDGDCEGAATQAQTLASEAQGLPRRVDSKLKSALVASAGRLQDLVSSKCTAAGPTGVTGSTGVTGTTGAQQQTQQEHKPGKAKKPKKAKKPEQNPGEVTPPDQLPPGQGGGTPNNGTDNGGSNGTGGVTP